MDTIKGTFFLLVALMLLNTLIEASPVPQCCHVEWWNKFCVDCVQELNTNWQPTSGKIYG